jgi:GDP-L-fucose synthase
MKRILVFGGHGFLGKNLKNVFENSEYEVYYISRRDGVDLRDEIGVTDILKKINPDIIIQAAAHVGSINYVSNNCCDIIHDNSQMYLNLYKCVANFNKKIIIINPISNCSYPGIIDIQSEETWWDGRVHESVESYGLPKKLSFVISECYKKQYNIKTINLIIPNAYGPNDYVDQERTHAMNGIVMRMIKSIKNGDKYFTIWGSGNPIREWVYMPDIANLIKEIIDNQIFNLPNPINVGQEYGITINESVDIIKKLLNYDCQIKNDLSRQDGAPIKILSKKLFNDHFPNFKFTNYEDGIRNTIKYYKNLIK